jgi:RNA polymerase sigma-70 factor (ECF subfamily)
MLAAMRRREAVVPGDDAALVERARAGDREAFRALVESHLPQVWRVVWRILRHREDTEDVVQEVFLAAHSALGDYRGDARFSTWLHRIAVNRALHHHDRAAERLRRASRPLEEPAEDDGEDRVVTFPALAAGGLSPLQELEMKELKRRLAECLEKLPAAWRAALALRDGESLPYEEIARGLGIALGTVRSRLARARLSLRRCIEVGP